MEIHSVPILVLPKSVVLSSASHEDQQPMVRYRLRYHTAQSCQGFLSTERSPCNCTQPLHTLLQDTGYNLLASPGTAYQSNMTFVDNLVADKHTANSRTQPYIVTLEVIRSGPAIDVAGRYCQYGIAYGIYPLTGCAFGALH